MLNSSWGGVAIASLERPVTTLSHAKAEARRCAGQETANRGDKEPWLAWRSVNFSHGDLSDSVVADLRKAAQLSFPKPWFNESSTVCCRPPDWQS